MRFPAERVGHLSDQRKLFTQEGSAIPPVEDKDILLMFEDPAPSHLETYEKNALIAYTLPADLKWCLHNCETPM